MSEPNHFQQKMEFDVDTEVCRLCLATNCKIYPIKGSSLLEMFRAFVDDYIMSAVVCWECMSRLKAATRLKEKAKRAQILLFELVQSTNKLSTLSLETNRLKHKLCSDLLCIPTKTIDIDLTNIESIEIKKEIMESDSDDDDNVYEPPAISIVPIEYIKKDLSKDLSMLKIDAKRKKRKTGRDRVKKCRKSQHRKDSDKALESAFKIRKLTHEQQIEEFERKKEHSRFLGPLYKCTLCYTAFSDESKYNKHITRHKMEWGEYECQICKLRSKTLKNLKSHLYAWHSVKYSCRHCKMVTKNRSAAFRHLERHAGTTYDCPLCPAKFTHPSTYFSHKRLKHVSECVCELCGYTFVSQKGIQTHKFMMHPLEAQAEKTPVLLKGPHCAECDVKFVSQGAYDRHLTLSAKHSSDEALPRNKAGRTSGLARTPKNKEPRRKFVKHPITCEVCGEVVIGRMAYVWHFRKRHPAEERTQFPPLPEDAKRVYICDMCGKTFTNSSFLRDHTLSHNADNKFECEICKKTFSQRHYLRLHLKIHSEKRDEFTCEECNKTFTRKSNLDRHNLIHQGQRLYKCSHCEKSFNSSDGLRSHTNHIHLKVPWPSRVRTARRSVDQ